MNVNNQTFIDGPTLREIYVRRNDGGIEYKTWLIYDLNFPKEAQKKIVDFIATENMRCSCFSSGELPKENLITSAGEYCNLITNSRELPPRLLSISAMDFIKLPTELTQQEWLLLGDSVGGISAEKPTVHNGELEQAVKLEGNDVLFSPGLLCRIPIQSNSEMAYIFQLAEKNLRTKGIIFYKPIGGHLKYKNGFKKVIDKLKIRAKNSLMPQDDSDIDFFVPAKNFDLLRKLFLSEIQNQNSKIFVNPINRLIEEINEEIGPINSSDGISLLTANEIGEFIVTQRNVT